MFRYVSSIKGGEYRAVLGVPVGLEVKVGEVLRGGKAGGESGGYPGKREGPVFRKVTAAVL